jgi:hypothetical protein
LLADLRDSSNRDWSKPMIVGQGGTFFWLALCSRQRCLLPGSRIGGFPHFH